MGEVQRNRLANERLERGIVELRAFGNIDRAPGTSRQAGVEQTRRVFERCAARKRQLDLVLVALARADDPGMALLATVATLVLYLVAALAALRLTQLGTLKRGAMTGVTILGLIYGVWTLYGSGFEATAWGAVLLATGIPVYWIMRWRGGSSPQAEAFPAGPPGSSA